MNQEREILNSDDVISLLRKDEGRFISGNTLKIQQLYQEYSKYVEKSNASASNKEIFEQYIECEVLRQNSDHKGWRKGKIKFVIQFEPEASEANKSTTTLDDIRQQIDTVN